MSLSSFLSPQQLAEFEDQGAVRLPGFLDVSDVDRMATALWADLARRYGAERDNPGTWPHGRAAQFQQVERSGAFNALGSPSMRALADAFAGEGRWLQPRHWGQALVTFPTSEWDVPHAVWHLDYPPSDCLVRLPALSVFAFLEPVRPRGGGTPYVAGSHRVVMERARAVAGRARFSSADMRALLKAEEPWFTRLFTAGGGDRERAFMGTPGTARGMPVQVCEMTGEPGDVMLMHPAMIHGIAGNALDRPRMMLVHRIKRGG